MRRTFATELYKHMEKDNDIWLVTADLGFGMWDKIRDDFPDRFLNTGASEQAASDICVGLALKGKKPFFYTITPFLFRCFETLRTYIDHEQINVKLVGSGRDSDYEHDGFSHFAGDIKPVLDTLKNIKQYWPDDKEDIADIVKEMVKSDKPAFISLRR